MKQYLPKIREILNEYARIDRELKQLLEKIKMLNLEKQNLDLALTKTREDERVLIDKIIKETGKAPDFYKILNEINDESSSVVK